MTRLPLEYFKAVSRRRAHLSVHMRVPRQRSNASILYCKRCNKPYYYYTYAEIEYTFTLVRTQYTQENSHDSVKKRN